jgi:iron(III) transport system permease protein
MSVIDRLPPLGRVVAAVVAAAMATPLAYLVLRGLEADGTLLLSARMTQMVWDTVRLAGMVTFASLAIGGGAAWLLERTDVPFNRVLGVAAALPLAVPSYVAGLAIVSAFGPRGTVARFPGLIGFWGAALALVLTTYPYVLLVTRAALRSADPTLESAARSLGLGRSEVLRRAQLPQMRAALAASSLLSALYVLSDFGAVTIFRYPTLTRGIFVQYRSSFDRSVAALMALVLVGLTVAFIVGERLARGPVAPPRTQAPRPADRLRLGRWRFPATAALLVPALVGVGVPVSIAVGWAGSGSVRSGGPEVLTRAAATSLSLSAVAALAAVALCLPVAVDTIRRPGWVSRLIESAAVAGYALPGLVVALSLVFLAARGLPFAYQTLGLVVAAYVIRFLPEALAAARASLAAVNPTLAEASRTLGAPRWATSRRVSLPLVRGGLAAGGALVFLTAMKELPATLLLRPAGVDTLAVRVWTGASEGFYGQAAPAALLLLAISALALFVVGRRGPDWRARIDG